MTQGAPPPPPKKKTHSTYPFFPSVTKNEIFVGFFWFVFLHGNKYVNSIDKLFYLDNKQKAPVRSSLEVEIVIIFI